LHAHRQQQPLSAETKTRALPIRTAARNLLLRAEFVAANLEPLSIQVLAEAALRGGVERITQP
jgi:hypothetical protein